jgi:anaerobic ribonucleoside-triphosphate reductase
MQIIKRNGSRVDYEPDKIYQAILKAANSVFIVTDELRAHLAEVTRKVTLDLEELGLDVITISMVQSQVEQRLLSAGYTQIAEHYIEYRLQRDIERYGYADHIAVHLRFEHLR